MEGYIKIFRNILDWEWWSDINTYRVFTYMLFKANWKDGKFKGIDIPKGSFASSISKISVETCLSAMEVRTAIKHLVSTNEITSKSYGKFTVFTILNYCVYQDVNNEITSKEQTDNKEVTSREQTVNNLLTTIEERNKERREEDIRVSKDTLCQTDVRRAVEKWNELSACGIKPVTKVNSGSKRYDSLCARIREYGIDTVIAAIERIKDSDFLQGKNNRNWIITFDWLVKPSNFPKVLEGNYDNSGGENNPRPRYSADNDRSDQTDSEKCREFWDNL